LADWVIEITVYFLKMKENDYLGIEVYFRSFELKMKGVKQSLLSKKSSSQKFNKKFQGLSVFFHEKFFK